MGFTYQQLWQRQEHFLHCSFLYPIHYPKNPLLIIWKHVRTKLWGIKKSSLLTFNYPSLFTSHHTVTVQLHRHVKRPHHAGPHSKHTFHYSLRPRHPLTYRGGRPRVSPLPRVTSPVNKVWTHSLPPEFTVQLQQIAGSQQEKNSPHLTIFFLFNGKIACKPFPDLLFSLLLG